MPECGSRVQLSASQQALGSFSIQAIMNGGTTEANLAEFFDSYAMALQPQDLTAQLPSSHNALFQPAAVDHELLRQLDREMIVVSISLLHTPRLTSSRAVGSSAVGSYP